MFESAVEIVHHIQKRQDDGALAGTLRRPALALDALAVVVEIGQRAHPQLALALQFIPDAFDLSRCQKTFDLLGRRAGPFALALSLFSLCHCHLGKSFVGPPLGGSVGGKSIPKYKMLSPKDGTTNQYSTSRVGAGIPRPIASTTNQGGEYPPLRAVR